MKTIHSPLGVVPPSRARRTKSTIAIVLCALLISTALHSQVIYSARSGNSLALFQENNGVITQMQTGFVEHNFPSISRDSRFVVFSTPDPVVPALQVPPSSDILIFDRATSTTRRVINTNTEIQGGRVLTYRPISAALSPNNSILAYGLELTERIGTASPSSGRALIVASAGNGVQISAPTNVPQGESTNGQFVGLSWDPSGNSFVTPYLGQGSGLPAIWRVSKTGQSQWQFTQQLTNSTFGGGQANIQIYPAISPSGAGLAFFNVFFADVFTGTQPAVATLWVGNSNGSGGFTQVANFNPGFYPAGLAWSRDGTRLVYSVAEQIQINGVGYTTLINPNNAAVRQVPTSGGVQPSPVPGIGNTAAIFPSVPTQALIPLANPNAILKTVLSKKIKKLKKKIKRAKKSGNSGKAKKLKKKFKKFKRRLKAL